MNDKYRVRELALNKDGSNVWFYPQVKKEKNVTKGHFWWKKTEKVVEWNNFYLDSETPRPFNENDLEHNSFVSYFKVTENVIAFRNFCDAVEFVKKICKKEESEAKKNSEKLDKYVGSKISLTDHETIKKHKIK